MSLTTVDTNHTHQLEVLAEGIRQEHAAIEGMWRATLDRAIALGEMLIDAKGLVGHGQWLPWVEDHAGLPRRTASRYMRLAREKANVAHLGTMKEALAALTAGRPEPEVLLDREGQEVTDARLEAALQEVEAALATGATMPRIGRETVLVTLALFESELRRRQAREVGPER
jgi:hypothetical protein